MPPSAVTRTWYICSESCARTADASISALQRMQGPFASLERVTGQRDMDCCRSPEGCDRFGTLSYGTHTLKLLLEESFERLPLRSWRGHTSYFAQHPFHALGRADPSSSASCRLGSRTLS